MTKRVIAHSVTNRSASLQLVLLACVAIASVSVAFLLFTETGQASSSAMWEWANTPLWDEDKSDGDPQDAPTPLRHSYSIFAAASTVVADPATSTVAGLVIAKAPIQMKAAVAQGCRVRSLGGSSYRAECGPYVFAVSLAPPSVAPADARTGQMWAIYSN